MRTQRRLVAAGTRNKKTSEIYIKSIKDCILSSGSDQLDREVGETNRQARHKTS